MLNREQKERRGLAGSRGRFIGGPAALMALVFALAPTAQAQQDGSAHKWSGDGLSLELAPLTPEQVRAFFIGRGFAPADAEQIAATACLFRSAIGHAGSDPADPPIAIRLADWRVVHGGTSRPPRLREDWEAIWSERKVAEEAAIAFHWALFPSEQTFSATDYNWGFLTFALPPGSTFDLKVAWQQGGVPRSHELSKLECGK